jgi:hypothetical protein
MRYKWEKLFLFAGATYFVVDALNTHEVSEGTLILSGSLITAAILARLIIPRTIKIKGGRKLKIIH